LNTPCEGPGCSESGTHTVTIDFPGESREVWTVCRRHERALKRQAVASRPKASPPKQEPTTIEVRCGACGGLLAEAPCLAIEQRQPCPECGSLQRRVAVGIHEQLPLHDSLRARSRRPGKSGWLVDTEAGDDYTKLLEGWGSREVIYDREQDRYRELIKLHDGTRIESVARLSDHRQ
jgi:phage FluMu protein Com